MGGLGTWLFSSLREKGVFDPPPPPRLTPSMIQGAWLNVPTAEGSVVGKKLGTCLADHIEKRGEPDEEKLQDYVRSCERVMLRVHADKAVVGGAIDRRFTLTRPIWPDEEAHEAPSASMASKADAMNKITQDIVVAPATAQPPAPVPPATPVLHATPTAVSQAWKRTRNGAELVAAAWLEKCLNKMGGDLAISVKICELRGMSEKGMET